MNSPGRVIGFVNAPLYRPLFDADLRGRGHRDGGSGAWHGLFPNYWPYATPGFVAFGAGSLLTAWLGDRWSAGHMMVILFVGIGASMIAVGLVQTPLQLGAALLSIGLLPTIYHPVRPRHDRVLRRQLGREMGLNGVWGQSRRGVVGAGYRGGRAVPRLAAGLLVVPASSRC